MDRPTWRYTVRRTTDPTTVTLTVANPSPPVCHLLQLTDLLPLLTPHQTRAATPASGR
jgi:hypothetical protein